MLMQESCLIIKCPIYWTSIDFNTIKWHYTKCGNKEAENINSLLLLNNYGVILLTCYLSSNLCNCGSSNTIISFGVQFKALQIFSIVLNSMLDVSFLHILPSAFSEIPVCFDN